MDPYLPKMENLASGGEYCVTMDPQPIGMAYKAWALVHMMLEQASTNFCGKLPCLKHLGMVSWSSPRHVGMHPKAPVGPMAPCQDASNMEACHKNWWRLALASYVLEPMLCRPFRWAVGPW